MGLGLGLGALTLTLTLTLTPTPTQTLTPSLTLTRSEGCLNLSTDLAVHKAKLFLREMAQPEPGSSAGGAMTFEELVANGSYVQGLGLGLANANPNPNGQACVAGVARDGE